MRQLIIYDGSFIIETVILLSGRMTSLYASFIKKRITKQNKHELEL